MTDEIDKKIEDFIQTDKEDQTDSIDTKQVENTLGEMGWLFDASRKKLEKDRICFVCKRETELGKEPLHIREATGVEKGVFALVSICDKCMKEQIENANKDIKE